MKSLRRFCVGAFIQSLKNHFGGGSRPVPPGGSSAPWEFLGGPGCQGAGDPSCLGWLRVPRLLSGACARAMLSPLMAPEQSAPSTHLSLLFGHSHAVWVGKASRAVSLCSSALHWLLKRAGFKALEQTWTQPSPLPCRSLLPHLQPLSLGHQSSPELPGMKSKGKGRVYFSESARVPETVSLLERSESCFDLN